MKPSNQKHPLQADSSPHRYAGFIIDKKIGTWLYRVKCTECNELYIMETLDTIPAFNYCPMCGTPIKYNATTE